MINYTHSYKVFFAIRIDFFFEICNIFLKLRVLCYNRGMREIKNVLICGLGAVGMTFACKIQKRLPECLRVLVDTERLQRYSNNPPKMNGEEKFFDYILPYETGYKADLVLIATKFDGLDSVCENLKNFVDEDTVILPILNGIEAEEKVAGVYGAEKVLYGFFIGHSAMREGNSVVQDGIGRIVFGSDNPQDMEKVESVCDFLRRAGVDFENPHNIKYAKWLKFALNVVSNQSSCILKMTFGEMQKSERFLAFAQKIVGEVMELARLEGIEGWENLEEDFRKALFSMVENGRTSMWQDVEAGKKTELEIFAGTVLKLGAKHGVKTPYNQVMYDMIRIIEERF